MEFRLSRSIGTMSQFHLSPFSQPSLSLGYRLSPTLSLSPSFRSRSTAKAALGFRLQGGFRLGVLHNLVTQIIFPCPSSLSLHDLLLLVLHLPLHPQYFHASHNFLRLASPPLSSLLPSFLFFFPSPLNRSSSIDWVAIDFEFHPLVNLTMHACIRD